MSSETNAVSPIVAVTLAPTGTNVPETRPRGEAQPRSTDYRLVIEQGPRMGSYVYKTVDRSTGETIKQFPREDVVKLINDPLYATGTIANTKA
jgi:flagellar protein FlaG